MKIRGKIQKFRAPTRKKWCLTNKIMNLLKYLVVQSIHVLFQQQESFTLGVLILKVS